GVYYFNEENKNWEYVGGKVTDPGTITFETKHFSKYAVMEYDRTFVDISGHWAQTDVEIMAAKHIANGVTANNFAPDKNITRAEFAALLVRTLKLETTGDQDKFTDVAREAWYKDSVMKAYNADIISGINETAFAPEANITREQMATILMRAYAYTSGKDLDQMITTSEVKFKDEGASSSWARRNVRLVESLGLMNGTPDGSFKPKDNATRAEAIVVIKHLMEKLDI
ncbi:S-layer homology domain-containing protein, partial [Anaerosolibacter sp.]|uniref:S-layer homology domain-containing protein n=1 Tax=Anaerosolibacter sp. TaxID=1872527 RepID=UPI0039EFF155